MQTKKSVQSAQAGKSPAKLSDLVAQSILGDIDPRSNKEVQRDEAIRAHYVQVMDAYGKVWPEHIADGICEHCHAAEGVRIGKKVRCPDCVDRIMDGRLLL